MRVTTHPFFMQSEKESNLLEFFYKGKNVNKILTFA